MEPPRKNQRGCLNLHRWKLNGGFGDDEMTTDQSELEGEMVPIAYRCFRGLRHTCGSFGRYLQLLREVRTIDAESGGDAAAPACRLISIGRACRSFCQNSRA